MEQAVLGNGKAVTFDRFSIGRVDRQVLVDIWREACRHIEIQESTHTIGGILGKLAPIGQLLVRRIDRQRSCLETVAVGVAVTLGLSVWALESPMTHGLLSVMDAPWLDIVHERSVFLFPQFHLLLY